MNSAGATSRPIWCPAVSTPWSSARRWPPAAAVIASATPSCRPPTHWPMRRRSNIRDIIGQRRRAESSLSTATVPAANERRAPGAKSPDERHQAIPDFALVLGIARQMVGEKLLLVQQPPDDGRQDSDHDQHAPSRSERERDAEQ